MIKFDENEPVTEVYGTSSITWVNTKDVCYDESSFKKLLDDEQSHDYAFLCGSKGLRENKNMCLYAASKGVSIDILNTYGVLDDEIIIQSLIASSKGLSSESYEDQVGILFEVYNINTQLLMKIVELCPQGQGIGWKIDKSSNKNKNLKEIIKNNKELLLLCMNKDPFFYRMASDFLKEDSDVKGAYEKLNANLDKDKYIRDELNRRSEENRKNQQVYDNAKNMLDSQSPLSNNYSNDQDYSNNRRM